MYVQSTIHRVHVEHLRNLLLSMLLLLTFGQGMAQQRSLTWRWMNTPCGNILSCDTGCAACNLPDEQDAVLMGTNAAWIGVSACPQPFSVGDNAVFTEGWDIALRDDRSVLLSGVHIDDLSITQLSIRHRAWGASSMRLEVAVSLGFDGSFTVWWDGPVLDAFEKLDISDLGCATIPEGSTMGGFRIRLRAYGDTEGSWVLDEVRVETEPCSGGITTGMQASAFGSGEKRSDNCIDILGRSVGAQLARGHYLEGTRRVVVW